MDQDNSDTASNNVDDELEGSLSATGSDVRSAQNHPRLVGGVGSPMRTSAFTNRTSESGATSDRKRNRRAMADDGALDDILGQITSKLTTLSTKENRTEEDNIKAFTDVLNCSPSEAQFYLESSNWNVETAAMLWLENNPTRSYTASYSGNYLPALTFPTNAYPYPNNGLTGSYSGFTQPKSAPLFRAKQIFIPDLTEGWTARVSKSSGQVYFIHLATGTTQFSVPPGYADAGSSMDTAVDLSGAAADNLYIEEGMADDSTGDDAARQQQNEPISPTGMRPCTIPQNALLEGSPAQSGVKYNSAASSYVGSSGGGDRGRGGASAGAGGAFRSAMDAYCDEDSACSGRAVWDEGSGYSLNDAAYSVSSTTNSTSGGGSPVFGGMRSTEAHMSYVPGEGGGMYPITQDLPSTQPADAQPVHGITANHDGIAMLAVAPDADNSSDYFLGGFTPANSSRNSSAGNLNK